MQRPHPGESAPAPRLFLAVAVPAPVTAALAELEERIPGFRWTPPAQRHLTLRFLGGIAGAQVPPLQARLRNVAVAPFLLPVEGLGVFPPRGQPQVVWCGTGPGHPHLHQLRQQIDDTLLALGLDVDLQRFVPHFTLARVGGARPGAVADFLHRHRDFATAPFRVASFRLCASRLDPAGAVHSVVEEFPLLRT